MTNLIYSLITGHEASVLYSHRCDDGHDMQPACRGYWGCCHCLDPPLHRRGFHLHSDGVCHSRAARGHKTRTVYKGDRGSSRRSLYDGFDWSIWMMNMLISTVFEFLIPWSCDVVTCSCIVIKSYVLFLAWQTGLVTYCILKILLVHVISVYWDANVYNSTIFPFRNGLLVWHPYFEDVYWYIKELQEGVHSFTNILH